MNDDMTFGPNDLTRFGMDPPEPYDEDVPDCVMLARLIALQERADEYHGMSSIDICDAIDLEHVYHEHDLITAELARRGYVVRLGESVFIGATRDGVNLEPENTP